VGHTKNAAKTKTTKGIPVLVQTDREIMAKKISFSQNLGFFLEEKKGKTSGKIKATPVFSFVVFILFIVRVAMALLPSLLFVFIFLFGFSTAQYGAQSAVNLTYVAYSHATGQWVPTPTWTWGLVHLPDDYSTTTTKVIFIFFSSVSLFSFFLSISLHFSFVAYSTPIRLDVGLVHLPDDYATTTQR
jgi:hypothetical protein